MHPAKTEVLHLQRPAGHRSCDGPETRRIQCLTHTHVDWNGILSAHRRNADASGLNWGLQTLMWLSANRNRGGKFPFQILWFLSERCRPTLNGVIIFKLRRLRALGCDRAPRHPNWTWKKLRLHAALLFIYLFIFCSTWSDNIKTGTREVKASEVGRFEPRQVCSLKCLQANSRNGKAATLRHPDTWPRGGAKVHRPPVAV